MRNYNFHIPLYPLYQWIILHRHNFEYIEFVEFLSLKYPQKISKSIESDRQHPLIFFPLVRIFFLPRSNITRSSAWSRINISRKNVSRTYVFPSLPPRHESLFQARYYARGEKRAIVLQRSPGIHVTTREGRRRDQTRDGRYRPR